MFTGIVESLGTVESVLRGGSSLSLSIRAECAAELSLGDSVSVNGACLTVAAKSERSFSADVTPESFRRTSLSELSEGSVVNLERAMAANGRFGGHIVSGHIDGTGTLRNIESDLNAVNVAISVPRALGEQMIEKGSVAVDGVSLTIASISRQKAETVFSVAVIPHTWKHTALSKKRPGSIVNIECDVIGKYVAHFLRLDGFADKKAPEDESLRELLAHSPRFH